MYFIKFSISILFFIFLSHQVFAQKTGIVKSVKEDKSSSGKYFDVPLVAQERSYWCWAANLEMLTTAYTKREDADCTVKKCIIALQQYKISHSCDESYNECDSCCAKYYEPSNNPCDFTLSKKDLISELDSLGYMSNRSFSLPNFDTIDLEITNKRPMIAVTNYAECNGNDCVYHYVLITGWKKEKGLLYLYANDPSSEEGNKVAKRKTYLYKDEKSNQCPPKLDVICSILHNIKKKSESQTNSPASQKPSSVNKRKANRPFPETDLKWGDELLGQFDNNSFRKIVGNKYIIVPIKIVSKDKILSDSIDLTLNKVTTDDDTYFDFIQNNLNFGESGVSYRIKRNEGEAFSWITVSSHQNDNKPNILFSNKVFNNKVYSKNFFNKNIKFPDIYKVVFPPFNYEFYAYGDILKPVGDYSDLLDKSNNTLKKENTYSEQEVLQAVRKHYVVVFRNN